MISVTLSGSTFQDVVEQAKQFTEWVVQAAPEVATASAEVVAKPEGDASPSSPYGYRPAGVGRPAFYPVDDGTEWDEEALRDWVRRLTGKGRTVVKVLATACNIDPRGEAEKLRWPGTYWAGV